MAKVATDQNYPGSERATLVEAELHTLYEISQVLGRSLNLHDTLHGLLKILNDHGRLRTGMVVLMDDNRGELRVTAVHDDAAGRLENTRYRPGEGIVGQIFGDGRSLLVEQIASEPRFLGRMGVYDTRLPFLGVPIKLGDRDTVGVIAAQPPSDDLLPEQLRFMEMVANLVGQTVRLARLVETEKRELEAERDDLRREVKAEYGFENIVGSAPLMRRIFEQVRQVAKWNTTVLIRGQSGTGKELVANAIHYNSPRAGNPFVKLNCAALQDNLLESELFGHEKGAFTGATSQRTGRFEKADGGTLFLDEIGEISAAFQAKLLRVLQEGEFERVGGSTTRRVDVRVIAATNRDLENEVEAGNFREDLYYRLNVMPILMPSLHERIEDIPQLARFLIERIARKQGRELTLVDSAIRLLMRHDWPGNVRELENTLERATIMCENGTIDRDAIALTGLETQLAPGEQRPATKVDFNDPGLDERERVIAALEEAGWVQAKAARLLNMTPRQIAYRIQILDIKVRQI